MPDRTRVVEIRPIQDVKPWGLPSVPTLRGQLARTCLRLDLDARTAVWDPQYSWRNRVTMYLPTPDDPAPWGKLARCVVVESMYSATTYRYKVIVFLDSEGKALAWSSGLPRAKFDQAWPRGSFAALAEAGIPVTEDRTASYWVLNKRYPDAVPLARFLGVQGAMIGAAIVVVALFILISYAS